ncbi:MAG: hypothetical protein ACYC6N_16750 [Pirellulaceae bacterium]
MDTQLVDLMVVCLAACSGVGALLAAGGRSRGPHLREDISDRLGLTHLMAQLAVALFAGTVLFQIGRDLGDYPHRAWQALDFLAGLATFTAVVIHLWDPTARFPLPALYALGLTLVGMLLVARDLLPGRFLVWTGICELTGFALVAALLGWGLQKFPQVVTTLRIPGDARRGSRTWFSCAQAVLALAAILLIGWILVDPGFDAMGAGTALLGLAGHQAACPAALMLVGTAILMAGQSRGTWRAIWQYTAMATGVLFTCSIGWAGIDGSTAAPWSRRIAYLLVSATMMTLLTGFGLTRVFPNSGDWLIRARRAAFVFAGLALLLAAVGLVQWVVSG